MAISLKSTYPTLPAGKLRPSTLLLASAALVVIIILGVLAPWIAPADPNAVDMLARSKPPVWYADGSWAHLLGTDNIGRDLLSRCLYGIRTSFGIATLG